MGTVLSGHGWRDFPKAWLTAGFRLEDGSSIEKHLFESRFYFLS